MAGLLVRMELGNEKARDRSLAGEDTVVVVGSLVDEGAGHSLVAGEEAGCLRSLEREGKASAKETERSRVEEDKEIGFGEDIVVGLRSRVEGDSHPVGSRRNSRCWTL